MVIDPAHGEARDALAHDWHRFLQVLGYVWLPLPNHPETALDLAAELDLAGLILTGGDDIGVFPERDETEAALLGWAKTRSRPVIGVCRGFQYLHHWLGGRLVPVDPAVHRARRHEIVFEDGSCRVVNSFHNLAPELPAAPLEPLAWNMADHALEAASAPGLLGLMWHPEREPEPLPEDLRLFHRHLESS
jgi:putative glutamine amidotransferase